MATQMPLDLETPMEVVVRHLGRAPVDLRAIAGDLGLPVRFDASIGPNAGMIKRDDRAPSGFAITVNASDNPRRQRFTLTHEIAHYVLHADLIGDGVTDNPMFRSALSDQFERQANRFAADILLPVALVRAAHRANPDLIALARQFDVSRDAMRIRLEELGLV